MADQWEIGKSSITCQIMDRSTPYQRHSLLNRQRLRIRTTSLHLNQRRSTTNSLLLWTLRQTTTFHRMDGRIRSHQPQNNRWKVIRKRRSWWWIRNILNNASSKSNPITRTTSSQVRDDNIRRWIEWKWSHAPLPLKTKIKNRKSLNVFLPWFWLSRLLTPMANNISQRKHGSYSINKNMRINSTQWYIFRRSSLSF